MRGYLGTISTSYAERQSKSVVHVCTCHVGFFLAVDEIGSWYYKQYVVCSIVIKLAIVYNQRPISYGIDFNPAAVLKLQCRARPGLCWAFSRGYDTALSRPAPLRLQFHLCLDSEAIKNHLHNPQLQRPPTNEPSPQSRCRDSLPSSPFSSTYLAIPPTNTLPSLLSQASRYPRGAFSSACSQHGSLYAY